MTIQTQTLTDFLLARIAEDERAWSVLASETATAEPPIYGPRRAMAECEAKRRIVGNATNMHTSGPEWDEAARILAAVYADHPDFREEWRV